MNVYDFDDTIYDGDSSIDFWKYCLKRHKIRANYWFALLAASLGYVLGIYKKEKYKSVFFSFLMQLDNPEKEVKEFWKVHKHKMKAWYLAQYEAKDVVISASPDFLLKTICDELRIQLIASPVNPKSGQWQGTNCYGVEKVCRFREIFPNAAIVQFYSDSISDQPMAALAESAYIVKGERIIPWEAYKPKHFGCI